MKRQKKLFSEGTKFNYLTVVKEIDPRVYESGKKERIFLCRCVCGKEIPVLMCNLTSSHSKSCGCEKGDTGKNFFKHGLSKTTLHGVWSGMLRRCYNQNEKFYYRYGGRGVIVCDEWKDDFTKFYYWAIDNGYKEGLELDKDIIPQRLGIPAIIYSPEMCCFVTKMENCNSRSNSILFDIDGERLSFREISIKYNINKDTLYQRVYKCKMSILDAISYKSGSLSQADVKYIRMQKGNRNRKELSKKYNVAPSTISSIQANRLYKQYL